MPRQFYGNIPNGETSNYYDNIQIPVNPETKEPVNLTWDEFVKSFINYFFDDKHNENPEDEKQLTGQLLNSPIAVDMEGNIYTEPNEIFDGLKKKELFICLPQYGALRAIKLENEQILVSNKNLTADDFAEIPEEPTKEVYLQPGMDNPDVDDINKTFNIGEITGDKAALSWGDREFVILEAGKMEIPEFPDLLENMENTQNVAGPVPTDIKDAEMFCPKAPKPLGFFASIADKIVKVFNKEGTDAGKAFREAERKRTEFREKYSEWAKEHNRIFRKRQEIIQHNARYDKIVANTPEKLEQFHKMKDDRKMRVEHEGKELKKQIEYCANKRKVFKNHPVAGLADVFANGITRDNIVAYKNMVGNILNNSYDKYVKGIKRDDVEKTFPDKTTKTYQKFNLDEMTSFADSEDIKKLETEYIIATRLDDTVEGTNRRNKENIDRYNDLMKRRAGGEKLSKADSEWLDKAVTDPRPEIDSVNDLNDPSKKEKMVSEIIYTKSFEKLTEVFNERTKKSIENANDNIIGSLDEEDITVEKCDEQVNEAYSDLANKKFTDNFNTLDARNIIYKFDSISDEMKVETRKQGLIAELGNYKAGSQEFQDTMVKIAMAEALKLNSNRMDFVISRDTRMLSYDYGKIRDRQAEIKNKYPNIEADISKKKQQYGKDKDALMKNLTQEEQEYREIDDALYTYNSFLKKNPAILRVVEDIKGKQLPGNAVYGIYCGMKQQKKELKEQQKSV